MYAKLDFRKNKVFSKTILLIFSAKGRNELCLHRLDHAPGACAEYEVYRDPDGDWSIDFKVWVCASGLTFTISVQLQKQKLGRTVVVVVI